MPASGERTPVRLRGHCLVFSDLRICVEPLPVPVTLEIHRGRVFYHLLSTGDTGTLPRTRPPTNTASRGALKLPVGSINNSSERLLNAAAVPAPTSPPHPWDRHEPGRLEDSPQRVTANIPRVRMLFAGFVHQEPGHLLPEKSGTKGLYREHADPSANMQDFFVVEVIQPE
ncbi:unnamed protein product [Pleuronectes platessa]|uniref:Uncharacterized protein n=1 Tax=Pleuronectes platessa TaxID=8262 RepID=A0A9N7UQP3_PLEPL|nr:unnamed protein product [Pleuronectes platessa]